MTDYYEALYTVGDHYYQILESRPNMIERNKKLYSFILEFLDGCDAKMPLMKLNRWLGYIQGCMIERGYTTVEAERDFSRPYFRPLDYPVVDA